MRREPLQTVGGSSQVFLFGPHVALSGVTKGVNFNDRGRVVDGEDDSVRMKYEVSHLFIKWLVLANDGASLRHGPWQERL